MGAAVSIVVAPLTRGRIPCVVDRVNTVVTPGQTIDVLVTDQGIAVNPRRPLLMEQLRSNGIPLNTIEELRDKASRIVGEPEPLEFSDKIVGIVAYRDNTVIDVIRQVR